MKRFWTDVSIVDRVVLLDGKPIRTPAKRPLVLPSDMLAEAIADEWRAINGTIDPRALPLTGLANAAIDQVAPDPPAFAISVAKYAETDLLCYRAEAPPELVARQAIVWDPMLAWARARYDIAFVVTSGINHRAQPAETVARLSAAIGVRPVFELAALSPLVTVGGSLVAALMLADGAIDADAAFDATHLDELWQTERWGEDWMATDARALRRNDFANVVRFLRLL